MTNDSTKARKSVAGLSLCKLISTKPIVVGRLGVVMISTDVRLSIRLSMLVEESSGDCTTD